MTISATSTRGARAPGGVSGDGGRLPVSPAAAVAALPPPRFSQHDLDETRRKAEEYFCHIVRRLEREMHG